VAIWLAMGAQIGVASAAGAGLIAACRWLRRRSPLCAQVVVAGLLLRAAAMVILFWTSYLDLPILRQQHTGDGFWNLTIDARMYYQSADDAARHGLGVVSRGSASPAFVKALALWMRVVGSSPMSGSYLNLLLYMLLCVTIVAAFRPAGDWRTDLPCAAMLAAVSFSPVLVAHSTQPLKDGAFVCLIGILCVAALAFLPPLTLRSRSSAGALIMVPVFLAALYVIAGIRGYYAALVWSALALVLFLYLWRQRRVRFVLYAAACTLLLAVSWLTYEAGADLDYINPYASAVDKAWALAERAMPGKKDLRPASQPQAAVSQPAASVVTMVDQYRSGFESTPGATNVKPTGKPSSKAATPRPVDDKKPVPVVDEPPAPTPAAAAPSRAYALAVGMGLIFVPVTALRAMSIVHFSGGQGLLAIADLDTLFMDLTIVMAVALLVRHRSAVRDRLPYVCFAAALGLAATVLMAYIVTNFGTLFRLRLMAAAPLWMLPLALSTRTSRRDGNA
jgi:hypothetical protein